MSLKILCVSLFNSNLYENTLRWPSFFSSRRFAKMTPVLPFLIFFLNNFFLVLNDNTKKFLFVLSKQNIKNVYISKALRWCVPWASTSISVPSYKFRFWNFSFPFLFLSLFFLEPSRYLHSSLEASSLPEENQFCRVRNSPENNVSEILQNASIRLRFAVIEVRRKQETGVTS